MFEILENYSLIENVDISFYEYKRCEKIIKNLKSFLKNVFSLCAETFQKQISLIVRLNKKTFVKKIGNKHISFVELLTEKRLDIICFRKIVAGINELKFEDDISDEGVLDFNENYYSHINMKRNKINRKLCIFNQKIDSNREKYFSHLRTFSSHEFMSRSLKNVEPLESEIYEDYRRKLFNKLDQYLKSTSVRSS